MITYDKIKDVNPVTANSEEMRSLSPLLLSPVMRHRGFLSSVGVHRNNVKSSDPDTNLTNSNKYRKILPLKKAIGIKKLL
jgi:hypothetical protein